MGTSQSSAGPNGGVPMVPPWATDVRDDDSHGNSTATPQSENDPQPIAPPARFREARLALGKYVHSGDRENLRASLGHYIGKGYGGSATATRRFGRTAITAAALGNALASMASGQWASSQSPLDTTLLAGKTVEEIMDAVIEAVRPIDGTLDSEAQRAALGDSLVELLKHYPDADILNLDIDQRNFAIENFSSFDVFRQFELDLGTTILDKAPNASAGLSRLKEVRDYVKESVSAAFRLLQAVGQRFTANNVSQVVRNALQETFEVFEGYAE